MSWIVGSEPVVVLHAKSLPGSFMVIQYVIQGKYVRRSVLPFCYTLDSD